MKITTEPSTFQPITLKITFETEEEIARLWNDMHTLFTGRTSPHRVFMGNTPEYNRLMGELFNLAGKTPGLT